MYKKKRAKPTICTYSDAQKQTIYKWVSITILFVLWSYGRMDPITNCKPGLAADVDVKNVSFVGVQ